MKQISIKPCINREDTRNSSQFSYLVIVVSRRMKLPVIVTPPSIYYGLSTRKSFWEDNFALVKMRSCWIHNVRKHKDINNGDQYISLDISYKLDYIDKRKVTSLVSRYYVGISGKGVTTSLTLRTTRSSNNKNEAILSIADILLQCFMELLEEFRYLSYLNYRNKQFKNELTEAYLFLVGKIYHLYKNNNKVLPYN